MPKTHPFRKLSIDESLCEDLLKRKTLERRYGSLTEYVSEILDWYLEGLLVRVETTQEKHAGALITAAKIEPIKATSERAKTG